MTDRAQRTVLLVGAAGRVGQPTAAALLERGMAVRGLVRDPAAAQGLLPAQVDAVQGDLNDNAAFPALVEGVDAVVFVAGGAGRANSNPRAIDYESVEKLSRAALAGGVQHMVLLSSAGVTQPEHPHNCTFESILKWKRRGELALAASGLSYTIVRALGLRDRPGGQSGIRIVHGDRIAFGEDIARIDVGAFLAEVVQTALAGRSGGEGPLFDDVFDTAFEIFNDTSLPPGARVWAAR